MLDALGDMGGVPRARETDPTAPPRGVDGDDLRGDGIARPSHWPPGAGLPAVWPVDGATLGMTKAGMSLPARDSCAADSIQVCVDERLSH